MYRNSLGTTSSLRSQLLDMPADIIDIILCLFNDLDTLHSATATCRFVRKVYLSRHRSIIKAVADNAAFPAVAAARCLAQAELTRRDMERRGLEVEPLLYVDEEESLSVEMTLQEAVIICDNTKIMRELEHLYSWSHKDRLHHTSQLTEAESFRLRRAMYRFWLYCKEYSNIIPPLVRDEEEESEYASSFSFLYAFNIDELEEIEQAANFLKDIVDWTVTGRLEEKWISSYYSMDYACMGPQAVLHAFKTNHLDVDVASLPEAYFWNQKVAVVELKALEQGDDVIVPQIRSPILRDWTGIYDRCSRCKEDCALELWGVQDWPLLRTKVDLSTLSTALPGNLAQTDEPRQIMEYMSSPPVAGHGFVDYKPIVEDLIAIGPSACPRSLYEMRSHYIELMIRSEKGSWTVDGRYCTNCIMELIKERFWLWWYVRKQRDGRYIPSTNCVYGYHCSLQENIDHREKFNHFCHPVPGIMNTALSWKGRFRLPTI